MSPFVLSLFPSEHNDSICLPYLIIFITFHSYKSYPLIYNNYHSKKACNLILTLILVLFLREIKYMQKTIK